jgi:hypothetical protein
VEVVFTTFEAGCVVVFGCFFALQAAQETKVALSCKNSYTVAVGIQTPSSTFSFVFDK